MKPGPPIDPNYMRYEQMKAAWVQENPDATPVEYTLAVNQIAEVCGV